MAGEIHNYPVTATSANAASFWDLDKSLGGGLFESQKVPHTLMLEIMLGANVQQIHQADLVTLAGAAGLIVNKTYYIDDAVGGDRLLRVIAATTGSLYQSAFDLTTGETGVYVLSTDTFTPLVVNFKKTLSSANILAGGYFDILQLPAVAGAYWRFEQVDVQYNYGTVDYDGGSKISITLDGATGAQFADDTSILTSSANIFGKLLPAEIITATVSDNCKVNAKGQIYLNNPSTVGDGTLTFYGTARLITI